MVFISIYFGEIVYNIVFDRVEVLPEVNEHFSLILYFKDMLF